MDWQLLTTDRLLDELKPDAAFRGPYELDDPQGGPYPEERER